MITLRSNWAWFFFSFFFKSYLFFWPEVEEVWKDWHLDNTRGSGLSGCQSMTYNSWHEISQSATSIWPLGLERRPGALFKSFCSDKNTWKDDTQFQSSERSVKMVFFKAHRVAKPNEKFFRTAKRKERRNWWVNFCFEYNGFTCTKMKHKISHKHVFHGETCGSARSGKFTWTPTKNWLRYSVRARWEF